MFKFNIFQDIIKNKKKPDCCCFYCLKIIQCQMELSFTLFSNKGLL